jgi:two-component system nitrogen regulation response regulator GlnG
VTDYRPPEPSPAGATSELSRFVRDRLQDGSEDLYAETLRLVERQLLTEVLRHTRGNQSHAARVLGITRNSLRFKLRSLDLDARPETWSSDDQPGEAMN